MCWKLVTRLLILISFLTLPKTSEARSLRHPSAVVVGTVYCDTCFHDVFSPASHFIPGATVSVECQNAAFKEEVKTDENGKFKVQLPLQIGKHEKEIKGCNVRLVRSSEPYCAVASTASSSSIRLKSRKPGRHFFSAGFFSFKPLSRPDLCNRQQTVTPTRPDPEKTSKEAIAKPQFFLPPIFGFPPPGFGLPAIPGLPGLPMPSLPVPPVIPGLPGLSPPSLPIPPGLPGLSPPSLPVPVPPVLPVPPVVPGLPGSTPSAPPSLPVPVPPVLPVPVPPVLPVPPVVPGLPGSTPSAPPSLPVPVPPVLPVPVPPVLPVPPVVPGLPGSTPSAPPSLPVPVPPVLPVPVPPVLPVPPVVPGLPGSTPSAPPSLPVPVPPVLPLPPVIPGVPPAKKTSP